MDFCLNWLAQFCSSSTSPCEGGHAHIPYVNLFMVLSCLYSMFISPHDCLWFYLLMCGMNKARHIRMSQRRRATWTLTPRDFDVQSAVWCFALKKCPLWRFRGEREAQRRVSEPPWTSAQFPASIHQFEEHWEKSNSRQNIDSFSENIYKQGPTARVWSLFGQPAGFIWIVWVWLVVSAPSGRALRLRLR